MDRPDSSRGLSPFALLAACTVTAGWVGGHWVAGVLALAGFLLLPGCAVLGLFRTAPQGWLERLTLAAAIGLVFMMLSGWAASLLGPLLGVDRPLDRVPQLVVHTAVLALLVVLELLLRRRFLDDAPAWPVTGRTLLTAAGVSVLPFTAFLGASRVNNGNGVLLAQVAVFASWAVLALLLGWAVLAPRIGWYPRSWMLFSPVLAILWATSLRGEHLFGWDIQQEFSVAEFTSLSGIWRTAADGDAYRSMLSITSMPASIQSLTGISVEFVLRMVYPLLLAMLPVLTHRVLQRRTRPGIAVGLTVAMVAAAQAFPQQMVAIARQEVALFLFAAAVLVTAEELFSAKARRGVAAVLLGSVAFTHYTSAYSTAMLVVVAALTGLLLAARDPQARARRVITIPVAVVVLTMTLGWNLLIAPNGVIFDAPARDLSEDGVSVLAGEDQPFFDRWLQGTGARRVPVVEFEEELMEELPETGTLYWMRADPRITPFTEVDESAPILVGPLAGGAPLFQAARTVLWQLLLASVTLGYLHLWLRRRWRDGLSLDMLGLFTGALALNVVLRISSTAAEFYNPERAALHNALLLVIPTGILLERVASRLRPVALLAPLTALVVSAATWGITPYVFTGGPPAATSEFGENVERFVVSDAELRTARWLAENLEATTLVQTDRYGQVILLNVAERSDLGTVDILHSDFVDVTAWVFASSPQVIEGRARGMREGKFAVYTTPSGKIALERATLFATEETRVHR